MLLLQGKPLLPKNLISPELAGAGLVPKPYSEKTLE